MQIATEHPEAVRQGAGMRMKERLLLDRIALDAADITPRHLEPSTLVEAHLAHADRAVGQGAAMPARVAAQPAVGKRLVQLTVARLARQDLSQGRHRTSLLYSAPPSLPATSVPPGDLSSRALMSSPRLARALDGQHLRVIYALLGAQPCRNCDAAVLDNLRAGHAIPDAGT